MGGVGGDTDHDDALGQACVGQEINHTQPLGEPQGPEGRCLQGDGVGRGSWGRGDIARTQRARLVRGEPGFCRQAAVQVGQLRGREFRNTAFVFSRIKRGCDVSEGRRGLTSIRRISMERTVVKKNICRKKSDTSPTTANRQNSWKRTEFRNEQIPHRHKEEKDTLSHQR